MGTTTVRKFIPGVGYSKTEMVEVETCGKPNADFLSYEKPRKGNPFETTVYAFARGEVTCERLNGHGGDCGFTHRKSYVSFR